MPYRTKEGRAALLLGRVLERAPESFTRPELAELMQLKVSAYAMNIIDWTVRKGLIVEAPPKVVGGNLVRAYTAPQALEGRQKAEKAQKRLEEWNNGF
jgi:hypothetical protein